LSASLSNLVVDLGREFPNDSLPDVVIALPAPADEAVLAWIDETFGGTWSSEANAGSNVIARRGAAPVGFAALDAKGFTFAWLQGLGRERDVGVFGPIGVVEEGRKTGLGVALLRRALSALRERGYARALIPAVGDDRLVRYYADAVGARVAERFERSALIRPARRVLVMASGNGSNFQAVLDASRRGSLPIEVVALLSNDPRAYAIERAREAGMKSVRVVSWNRDEETRVQYDDRLLRAARDERPDLVLLLGWMHLLSDSFVRAFPHILNVHPAFLPLDPRRDDVVMPDGTRSPAFRGPRAVRDALAASSSWVGATLHRVTAATDRGPVMARKPLRVMPGEGEAALMERVHEIERGVVRAGLMRWLYER
jgi:phosphoribosylglycinamide formyltransferase 1